MGKKPAVPEATLSLASWVQVQPLPLGKWNLQPQPATLLRVHRKLLGDSTSLIPEEPQVLIKELESELCARSISNGRVCQGEGWKSLGLSQQHSDIHKTAPIVLWILKMKKGTKPTSSENS